MEPLDLMENPMDVTIRCPWCDEESELGEPSATEFRCPACATTVDLVPQPAAPARRELPAAA